MDRDYEWRHRDKDWIKANPGKGTMYKHYTDLTIELPKHKKDLPKEFKDKQISPYPKKVGNKCGVYVVICAKENYAYVGQSRDVEVRLRSHKMSIMHNQTKSADKTYKRMREHREEHGIAAFEFIPYKYLPGASDAELLKQEGLVMCEFMEKGYLLYNRSLPAELVADCVYCPTPYRGVINELIKKLTPFNSDKLKEFIEVL